MVKPIKSSKELGKKISAKLREKKYVFLGKRLKLGFKAIPGRKYILIHIDGLSYDVLKYALEKNKLPTIKKLLEKEKYKLSKWQSGLPPGTPHMQAGFFYGDNTKIPAYRYILKQENRGISFGSPVDCKYIEEKYFGDIPGSLEGGSSYGNIFSGDAEHSTFTLSTLFKSSKKKRFKESKHFLLLFANPWVFFKVLFYSFRELMIEIFESFFDPIYRLITGKIINFAPVMISSYRFFLNGLMRELQTIGCIIDMKRGMPGIYSLFPAYDEIAHLRGRISRSALWTLKSLDRNIKKIYKNKPDDYDLYIISDHGSSPSLPFELLYGKSLPEYIKSCIVQKIRIKHINHPENDEITRLRIISRNLRDLKHKFSKPFRLLLYPVLMLFGKSRLSSEKKVQIKKRSDIALLISSSMAQVYFGKSREYLTYRTIQRMFPGLVKKLLYHPGIGIIIMRHNNGRIILHKEGSIFLKNDKIEKKGKDFIKYFSNDEKIWSQLKHMSNLEDMGDMVLLGNYENSRIVSFGTDLAAHCSIGGPQHDAIFISKRKINLSKIENASQLYPIFRSYVEQNHKLAPLAKNKLNKS